MRAASSCLAVVGRNREGDGHSAGSGGDGVRKGEELNGFADGSTGTKKKVSAMAMLMSS